MPEARFRRSRKDGVCFLGSPFSLLLWTFLLLCSVASGAGQAALAQQKSGPAPSGAGAFNSAGIGTGSRTIDGLWQFHLGDDLRWAQPGFDDSGWERLPADKPWGDAEPDAAMQLPLSPPLSPRGYGMGYVPSVTGLYMVCPTCRD
jgi:hypothetical protein